MASDRNSNSLKNTASRSVLLEPRVSKADTILLGDYIAQQLIRAIEERLERLATNGSSPEAKDGGANLRGNSPVVPPPMMDVEKSAPVCVALGPNGTTNPCQSVGVPWRILQSYDPEQLGREIAAQKDQLQEQLDWLKRG